MAAGKTFQKITCHNQMAQEIQSSEGWPESGLQSCPALMLSCQVHIMPRGRDPKPVPLWSLSFKSLVLEWYSVNNRTVRLGRNLRSQHIPPTVSRQFCAIVSRFPGKLLLLRHFQSLSLFTSRAEKPYLDS